METTTLINTKSNKNLVLSHEKHPLYVTGPLLRTVTQSQYLCDCMLQQRAADG